MLLKRDNSTPKNQRGNDPMKLLRRIANWTTLLILSALIADAGTVTGVITTATSGPIANGTLTLTPTQPFNVVGVGSVVTTPVACYTDASGNVTGEPNPLIAPVVSVNTASGTLAAGTYFSKITYYDASGESAVSPEQTTILSAPGTLIFSVPARQPTTATGWKIYIGATSGSETLQSTQVGFAGSYSQTAALAAGAAMPVANTTACKVFFNDQGVPTGTGYTANLVNAAGSPISGFPQKWRLTGGANGTVNLSQGTPFYSGFTQFPDAIVATPASQAMQSINGALNYGVVGQTSNNSGNQTIGGTLGVTGNTTVGGTLGVTGQIKASDGTAGAPGYTFTNELTLGLFRPGAGKLVLPFKTLTGGNLLAAQSQNLDGAGMSYRGVHIGLNGVLTAGNSSGDTVDPTIDAGISRGGAAATWAIGNGTAGDASGTLKVAKIQGASVTGSSLGGLTPSKQIFTANGTFTIPAGVTAVKVTVVGAGGAGGGGNAAGSGNGGGGAAGGAGIKWLSGLTPGNTLAVTVGTGGTGASGTTGNSGTSSSVASGTQTISTITANGGVGGSAGAGVANASGAIETAAGTGGDINLGGAGGGFAFSSGPYGGPGGNSIFGGAGGNTASAGRAATGLGSGGGGAASNATQAGGAGAGGVVIFEWVL